LNEAKFKKGEINRDKTENLKKEKSSRGKKEHRRDGHWGAKGGGHRKRGEGQEIP